MRLQEFDIKKFEDQKHYNLISRHLKETIDLLRKGSKARDIEYEKLRLKHYHESTVFNYFRQIYQKYTNESAKSFYGYSPFKEITIKCKDLSIKGFLFLLEPNKIFNKIPCTIFISSRL
jgi:predicted PilT family ATPase